MGEDAQARLSLELLPFEGTADSEGTSEWYRDSELVQGQREVRTVRAPHVAMLMTTLRPREVDALLASGRAWRLDEDARAQQWREAGPRAARPRARPPPLHLRSPLPCSPPHAPPSHPTSHPSPLPRRELGASPRPPPALRSDVSEGAFGYAHGVSVEVWGVLLAMRARQFTRGDIEPHRQDSDGGGNTERAET